MAYQKRKLTESIRKIMINRDEKIENEIIKPKNKLINELYQDNLLLHEDNKLLNKFEETFHKFVHWICKNFTMSNDEDMLIRTFEQETRTFVDPKKQLAKEQKEKEWDLER